MGFLIPVCAVGGRLRSEQNERKCGGRQPDQAALLLHLRLWLLHGSGGVGRTHLHRPGRHLLPRGAVLGCPGENLICWRRKHTGTTGWVSRGQQSWWMKEHDKKPGASVLLRKEYSPTTNTQMCDSNISSEHPCSVEMWHANPTCDVQHIERLHVWLCGDSSLCTEVDWINWPILKMSHSIHHTFINHGWCNHDSKWQGDEWWWHVLPDVGDNGSFFFFSNLRWRYVNSAYLTWARVDWPWCEIPVSVENPSEKLHCSKTNKGTT